ncbi:SDR family oxidoreductase [Pedobacter frigoris]|uniref:SDR family NAD(P)-dependent oxidoreductase n=1 Tax=Pedobacter frigoris TaxID=2571272 RepID=UPI00292D39B0|nr:SDR family oxidoreductase [Pedobacter frigoris]
MNEYALITGASKGIGKAMALRLADKGYHLMLVARSEKELQELSILIEEQFQVKALYFSTDLSEKDAAAKVTDWVKTCTSSLSVLINNAGYGVWGDFDVLDLEMQMNMMRLNVDTVIALTYQLLPILKAQKQSYILNVSSTAAYQAVPTLALYAASKTFILSYSRALHFELKDSSVSVSCVCPGPTDTDFASRAGMDALADLANKFNMKPDDVAESALKGMFGKKTEIIPGFLNKLSAFGANHLPKSLIERITAGLYRR